MGMAIKRQKKKPTSPLKRVLGGDRSTSTHPVLEGTEKVLKIVSRQDEEPEAGWEGQEMEGE